MKAIMYHYVNPFDPQIPFLKSLHIDDFSSQLDYFQDNFGIVSREEFLAAFEGGPMPQGAVLTFDDGLKCHYEYVYRELKKRGLWGIFYVPTGMYQSKKILDVHRIHILLGVRDSREIYEQLKNIVSDDMLVDMRVEEFREATYRSQVNDDYTKEVKKTLNYYISYDYREKVLDKLFSIFKLEAMDDYAKFYINASEMKEMRDNGMTIGSHTVNHPVLSKLSADQQESEIRDSFAYLENICNGFDVKTFCYPYGGFHSFTDETEKILEANQCVFSFNVEHRDIIREDILNRPQALPRYDCNKFPHGQVRV